jgi:hypothetical protein
MGLGMGVAGLWLGATVAMLVSSSIFAVMLLKLDFAKRAAAINPPVKAVELGKPEELRVVD